MSAARGSPANCNSSRRQPGSRSPHSRSIHCSLPTNHFLFKSLRKFVTRQKHNLFIFNHFGTLEGKTPPRGGIPNPQKQLRKPTLELILERNAPPSSRQRQNQPYHNRAAHIFFPPAEISAVSSPPTGSPVCALITTPKKARDKDADFFVPLMQLQLPRRI